MVPSNRYKPKSSTKLTEPRPWYCAPTTSTASNPWTRPAAPARASPRSPGPASHQIVCKDPGPQACSFASSLEAPAAAGHHDLAGRRGRQLRGAGHRRGQPLDSIDAKARETMHQLGRRGVFASPALEPPVDLDAVIVLVELPEPVLDMGEDPPDPG